MKTNGIEGSSFYSIKLHSSPINCEIERCIGCERTPSNPHLLDSTRFDAIGVQPIPIDANLMESNLLDEIVVRW